MKSTTVFIEGKPIQALVPNSLLGNIKDSEEDYDLYSESDSFAEEQIKIEVPNSSRIIILEERDKHSYAKFMLISCIVVLILMFLH